MMLSLLNQKETLKFVDLAFYMVKIDDKPESLQHDILELIFREIGFVVSEYSFEKSDSIEATLDFFANANQVVKSTVYLNLVKISLVNDLYNTTEHQFLVMVQEKLGISPARRRELMSLAYDERDFRERVQRVLKDND